jgi:hypothetical protein
LTPAQIQERFPLFKVDRLAGGAFGSLDGTMESNPVLMTCENKAVALGAEFVVGLLVLQEPAAPAQEADPDETPEAEPIRAAG